ncbi:MAG: amidohydrolase family protein [Methanotrichaceae archaeon]|nr:amidohydrolase family protein [Methanotrichaceae archaeon]
MIIDFHCHIYPQEVAAKIFPAAREKLKVEVFGSGAPEDLRFQIRRSGIESCVILPLARGKDDVRSLNGWVKSVCGHGLVPFGAVHPFMDDLESELDRLQRAGCRGVKMMPLLQQFYPDDPRCSRLYEALIARNMILVTHAGCDPMPRGEVFGTPDRFARVIERYPDLTMVLAHLGGLGMWDQVRKFLIPSGGRVLFDTAYVSFYLPGKEMADLIAEIGPDRILFGSDYPWEDPGRAARIIQGLDVSGEEAEAMLWKNAHRLLR